MKILFLAPQSFFIERGTPIAVKLAVEVLSKKDLELSLLTFNAGDDLQIPNLKHYRSFSPKNFKSIKAGFSFKKVFCDFFLLTKTLRLIIGEKRKNNPFTLIHAVEESVFIALLVKLIFKIPYVYDMDSCLSDQLIEKYPQISFLAPVFNFFEKLAIKNSLGTLVVCDSLKQIADNNGALNSIILSDISLHEIYEQKKPEKTLNEELNLNPNDKTLVYVGNLEPYQGIDLLIKSSTLTKNNIKTIIIGGNQEYLTKYKKLVKDLNLENKVFFLGPKPLTNLHYYLDTADILASPRISGTNTPMKIYSYMFSGTPIVATNIVSHTQVLDENTAFLCNSKKEDFAATINKIYENIEDAKLIGENSKKEAQDKYSLKAFKNTLHVFYNSILGDSLN